MGRIQTVKKTGRQCRLCRRNGSFPTIYCVHGKGSALVESIGQVFDAFNPAISDSGAVSGVRSRQAAVPGKIVRRSQLRHLVGHMLSIRIEECGQAGESD